MLLTAKIWFYLRDSYSCCVDATIRGVREGHFSIFFVRQCHALFALVGELTWCVLLRGKLSFTFATCEQIPSRFRLC